METTSDLGELLTERRLTRLYKIRYKQGSMAHPGMELEVLLSPTRRIVGEKDDTQFYVVRNRGGVTWSIPQDVVENGSMERSDPDNLCTPAKVSPYFATQQELHAHTSHCGGVIWIGGADYKCAMCAEADRRHKEAEKYSVRFETRPVNAPVECIIKTSYTEADEKSTMSTALGTVLAFITKNGVPNGWMVADGRDLSKKDYPELYAVLGDNFCPQHIEQLIPEPWWMSKLREIFPGLNKRVPRKKKMLPNPLWKEGHFHIPDLRNSYPVRPPTPPEPSEDEDGSAEAVKPTPPAGRVVKESDTPRPTYQTTRSGLD